MNICVSCHTKLNTNQDKKFIELIDLSKKSKKPILFYFNTKNCGMCELFELKILSDKTIIDYLNSNFILKEVDIDKENIYSKIFYFYTIPLFAIIDNNKLESIFPNSSSSDIFLYRLQNYKSENLLTGLERYTSFEGDLTRAPEAINLLLYIEYMSGKDLLTEEEYLKEVENSFNEYPYFYNKYLYALSIESKNDDHSKLLKQELIESLLGIEKRIYEKEINHLFNEAYNLSDTIKSNIEFEKTFIDFGSVNSDEIVSSTFYFKNTGEQPLIIYHIMTTCGCTVPIWNKKPILPQQKDSVVVNFKGSERGVYKKSINVITNSEVRNTSLNIKATIN